MISPGLEKNKLISFYRRKGWRIKTERPDGTIMVVQMEVKLKWAQRKMTETVLVSHDCYNNLAQTVAKQTQINFLTIRRSEV